MADNPNFNSDLFKTNGDWTSQGSANAGNWQATTGQYCDPQQSNESKLPGSCKCLQQCEKIVFDTKNNKSLLPAVRRLVYPIHHLRILVY